jgi:hypothetical protein
MLGNGAEDAAQSDLNTEQQDEARDWYHWLEKKEEVAVIVLRMRRLQM